MLNKESPQVTRADSKFVSKGIYAAVLQGAFANQSKCAGNGTRSAKPGGSTGRGLGAAAQAWTIPCFSRGCSRRVIANVLLLSRRGGADGTAVDTAGPYCNEEPAVEARISRETGLGASLEVEFHTALLKDIASRGKGLDVFGQQSKARESANESQSADFS